MNDIAAHIVVVDDDEDVRSTVAEYLRRNGLSVSEADGGAALRELMATRPIDLALLDINMPGDDGLTLAREIRGLGDAGIIMLTAKSDDVDRIVGLEIGADDYITKPFNPRELLARVKAVLRRAAMPPSRGGPEVVRHGGLLIDIGGHRVVVGDHEVHLTPIEFRVLASLARKQGALVSHGQLLHDAWGPEYRDELPLLRTAIRGLRTKLADAAGDRDYIGTEYGLGYRLAPAGVDVAG